MKYFLLLILITFKLNAQKIDSDTKHFYAGFLITGSTNLIVKELTGKEKLSRRIGLFTGLMANFFKEFVYDDYFNKGVKSISDLYITTTGCIVATGLDFCIQDTKKQKQLDITYFKF